MWVVKLGGSLQSSTNLPSVISLLAEYGAGRIIIVPGGGIYADAIREKQRELNFSDEVAHKLALRAMEIYGTSLLALHRRLFAADNIAGLSSPDENKIPVWFPYKMTVNHPDIEASWNITSDYLSLWLARLLEIKDILIIKSVLPESNDYSAIKLSESGYLDRKFAQFLAGSGLKPRWCHHTQLDVFVSILNGKETVDKLELIS